MRSRKRARLIIIRVCEADGTVKDTFKLDDRGRLVSPPSPRARRQITTSAPPPSQLVPAERQLQPLDASADLSTCDFLSVGESLDAIDFPTPFGNEFDAEMDWESTGPVSEECLAQLPSAFLHLGALA
jgi:hypothetical protein